MQLATPMAPKVTGAESLAKFRLVTGLCAMRKKFGFSWLDTLVVPLRYDTNQTALVPKTRRCWTVLAAESSAADEGMGPVRGSGATGREDSVRPLWTTEQLSAPCCKV